MARLLLHAAGRHVTEPMGWPVGAIVEVRPDGSSAGLSETLPTFWWVDLVGITVEQVNALMDSQFSRDDNTPYLHPVNGRVLMFRKREWKLDMSRVPQSIIDQLNSTGQITVSGVSLDQIRNALRRVRDDIVYTGF